MTFSQVFAPGHFSPGNFTAIQRADGCEPVRANWWKKLTAFKTDVEKWCNPLELRREVQAYTASTGILRRIGLKTDEYPRFSSADAAPPEAKELFVGIPPCASRATKTVSVRLVWEATVRIPINASCH